jgi:hypothetical protein
MIVGIAGVCLMGSAGFCYFVSLKAGICAGLFLVGAGLGIDALRK